MAPGVTTHGTEMQARHVELAITHRGSSGLDAVAPPSANVAPPGWYMLFVLNDKGVPSVARWVHVQSGPKPPDPPQTLPHFGSRTHVRVVTKSARLHGRDVVLRIANRNAFDVPASATLRLPGRHTKLRPAARAEEVLPAHGSVRLTLRLGNKKAKLIRRIGHQKGRLSVAVSDPSGHHRKVSGPVRVWAPKHRG
jgi:hypothetical protein